MAGSSINLKKNRGNFSDALFNFEKVARNVAGFGNLRKKTSPKKNGRLWIL